MVSLFDEDVFIVLVELFNLLSSSSRFEFITRLIFVSFLLWKFFCFFTILPSFSFILICVEDLASLLEFIVDPITFSHICLR